MKKRLSLLPQTLFALLFLPLFSPTHAQDTAFYFSGSEWTSGNRSYAPMSSTYIYGDKIMNIYTSFGSKQSGVNKGLWLGSNATHKSKMRLDYDEDRRHDNLALARALGIQGSDTGYVALLFEDLLYEISEISYQPSALSGAAADSIYTYLLYSSNEGFSYQSLGVLGPQKANEPLVWRFFPPIKEARFAFVLAGRKDFVSRSPHVVFLRQTRPMVWVEDLSSQKLTHIPLPNTRVGDTSCLLLQLAFEKLQNDLHLSVPEEFLITPQRIIANDSSPQTIAVKFFPSNTKEYDGNLRLSGGGLLHPLELPLKAYGIDSNSPWFSLSPSLLPEFCAAPYLEKDSIALHLQGHHLRDKLHLSLKGDDSAAFYLSTPSSLSSHLGIVDTIIHVIYAPTAEGTHLADLLIEGKDLEPLRLPLRASAQSPSLDSIEGLETSEISARQFSIHWKSVAHAHAYQLFVRGKNCSENFVTNGGFEEGKHAWTGITPGSIVNDSKRALSGTGLATHLAGNCRFEQVVKGLEIGQEYIFSFAYSGFHKSSSNGLKNYSIHGSSGTRYLDFEATQHSLEKSIPWRRYELRFVALEPSIKISLRTYEACILDEVNLQQCQALTVEGSPFRILVDETIPPGTRLSKRVDSLLPNSEYLYSMQAEAPHYYPSPQTGPIRLQTSVETLPLLPSSWITLSPPPGNYSQSQSMHILLTPPIQGKIRYTLDSTDPNPHSPLLEKGQSLLLDHSCLLRYSVEVDGYQILVDSAIYRIERLKTPRALASMPPATYYTPIELSLYVTQPNLEIHYTLDSTLPLRNSPRYTSPLPIHQTVYFQALAFGDEMDSSPDSLYGGRYTIIPLKKVSAPFTFQGGKDALTPSSGWHPQHLGNDYGKPPHLRFDNASNLSSVLTLGCDTSAVALSYDIKWYKGSLSDFDGLFCIESSVDGRLFSPLKEYTHLHPPPSSPQNDSLTLPPATTFLRWRYTEKRNGNISIGNIRLHAAPHHTIFLLSPAKDSVYPTADIPVHWELSTIPMKNVPSDPCMMTLQSNEENFFDTLFAFENHKLLSQLFPHRDFPSGNYLLKIFYKNPHDSLTISSVSFAIARPECPQPTALKATNIEAHSARLCWDSNNTLFQLKINEQMLIVVEGHEYLLSDLQASSTYHWAIRTLCSPNDSSTWTEDSFSTPVPSANHSLSSSEFTLYPNPAKEYLFLHSTSRCRIEVYSLGGQKMADYPASHSQYLSLETYPRGAYLVCFIREDGRRHSTIVILK